MNTKSIALLAIALWILTAVGAIFLFIKGNTRKAEDGRSAVVLSPADRILVLTEMRALLEAVRGITDGVRKGDRTMIANAAARAGTAAMVDENPELIMRLPLDFKQLGLSVHRGFDDIAAAARLGKAENEMLGLLSQNLNHCIACHAGYQIRAAE